MALYVSLAYAATPPPQRGPGGGPSSNSRALRGLRQPPFIRSPQQPARRPWPGPAPKPPGQPQNTDALPLWQWDTERTLPSLASALPLALAVPVATASAKKCHCQKAQSERTPLPAVSSCRPWPPDLGKRPYTMSAVVGSVIVCMHLLAPALLLAMWLLLQGIPLASRTYFSSLHLRRWRRLSYAWTVASWPTSMALRIPWTVVRPCFALLVVATLVCWYRSSTR